MIFAFTGFSQDGTYRVFSFELLPRHEGGGTFLVKADLALARKYRIPLQELPLLCRALLENRQGDAPDHTIIYSASDMSLYANARLAADENRKLKRGVPPRRAIANS